MSGIELADCVEENNDSSGVIWLQHAESKNQDDLLEVADKAVEDGLTDIERTCLRIASRSLVLKVK